MLIFRSFRMQAGRRAIVMLMTLVGSCGAVAQSQTPPPWPLAPPQVVEVTAKLPPPSFGAGVSLAFDGILTIPPIDWTLGNRNKQSVFNDSAPNCDSNPTGRKPVIIKSGEKEQKETDFRSLGLYGFSLTRTYHSNNAIAGMFGYGWRGDYDWSINTSGSGACYSWGGVCYPRLLNVFFPNGSHYTYTLNTGDLHYYAGNADKLGYFTFQLGVERWTLTTGDGVFVFDANGAIIRQLTPNGAISSTAVSGGYTNTAGQAVSFNYVSGKVHTIVDPNGKVWTYDYNANGMLSQVTSPNGHVRVYGYDPTQTQKLTSITVDGVQTLAVSWYSNAKVQKSGTPDGEQVDSFTYGTNTTTQTTESGDVQTYTFGTYGSLGVSHAASSSCAAAMNTIAYDSHGFVDYTLDFNGNKTDYTYDSTGLLLDVTYQAGTANAHRTTTSWTYAGSTNKEQKETFYNTAGAAYRSTTFSYFTSAAPYLGLLQSKIDKDELTGITAETDYTYQFDGNKHLTQQNTIRQLSTGPATSTINYDSYGNKTSSIDAVGNATYYANYDGLGRPGQITQPEGAVHTLSYDAYGNIVSDTVSSSAGSGTSTYSYDGDNNLTSYTLANGESGSAKYTPGGRMYLSIDQFGNSKSYGYTASTNTYTETSQRNSVVWSGTTPTVNSVGYFSYATHLDSRGRPLTETGNNGQVTTHTFDKQNNHIGLSDATGSSTSWVPDGEGRIIQQNNSDGGHIIYARNEDGQIASFQTPRGVSFQYKRNGLGGLKEIDSPDAGNKTLAPDAFGRPATEARANGTSIAYSWDKLDRKLSRSNSDVEYFHYDEGNGKGHLTSFSNPSSSRSYGFDTLGHVVAQSDVVLGNSFSQSRLYSGAGLMTWQKYPSGLQISFSYTSEGRISAISTSSASYPSVISKVVYQPNHGARIAWLFGNGLGRSVSRDADKRVTSIITGPIQNVNFDYFVDNNLKTQTDSTQPSVTTTFDYDANKRLKTATRSGDNQGFTWDVDSNLSASSRAGVNTSYGYAPSNNRLASVNGAAINYMTGGGDFYTWGAKAYTRDAFDRLKLFSVGGAAQATYFYNAADQRVAKTVGAGTFYYTYDPEGRLTSETSPGGVETDYIWLDNDLIAVYKGGVLYYAVTDASGRPQYLLNQSQAIVWQAKNASFDRQIVLDSIGGLNVGFAGQYYDSESGMFYNWHRYYEPTLGRYIQSDPIGMAGGINTYTYVNGNPVSFIDPLGTDIWVGSPGNGSPHMNISVGIPGGTAGVTRATYTYGVDLSAPLSLEHGLTGTVYFDPRGSDPISYDSYYLITGPGQDAEAIAYLNQYIGKTDEYGPSKTCINFSMEMFNNLKSMLFPGH